jgi:hypothetical protein
VLKEILNWCVRRNGVYLCDTQKANAQLHNESKHPPLCKRGLIQSMVYSQPVMYKKNSAAWQDWRRSKRTWCLMLTLCASWRLLYTRNLEVIRCKEATMRSLLCIVSVQYVRRVSENFKVISGRYNIRILFKTKYTFRSDLRKQDLLRAY